jgi:sugar phosphate isomerase/epimerase
VIRLGGHGLPVAAEGDPVAFARAHRAFGYRAAYCPPVAVGDAARLAAIEAAFAAEDVVLAEIGIWRNLNAVEEDVRRATLAHARDCLAIADAVGARCAVSYIGSFAPATDYAPHPLNMGRQCFDATVETVRGIIDAVKPRRAKLALEMMQYSLPDSVDCYLDLIAAVDRLAFAAHVDPVNLVMTPRTYFDTGALVRDIFARLGPHIVSCHAKDITLHHQAALHFDEVMIGDGVMDYPAYLGELDRLGRDVPLMLEHLEGAEYAVARDRLFAVGRDVGIGF